MRALEDRSPFDGPEIVEEQRRARSQGGNMKATEFELWKEDNCECGIADETGEWSAELFEEFGCNCEDACNCTDARRPLLTLRGLICRHCGGIRQYFG